MTSKKTLDRPPPVASSGRPRGETLTLPRRHPLFQLPSPRRPRRRLPDKAAQRQGRGRQGSALSVPCEQYGGRLLVWGPSPSAAAQLLRGGTSSLPALSPVDVGGLARAADGAGAGSPVCSSASRPGGSAVDPDPWRSRWRAVVVCCCCLCLSHVCCCCGVGGVRGVGGRHHASGPRGFCPWLGSAWPLEASCLSLMLQALRSCLRLSHGGGQGPVCA